MIPDEKRFRFRDGTSAGTLQELLNKIETISYDEFYGHVNEEKNDFANWVGGVLGENQLADHLRKVTSIVETVELIAAHANPEEIERHEAELQERHVPDFQAEIERKIFGQPEAPPPEIDDQPSIEPVESTSIEETRETVYEPSVESAVEQATAAASGPFAPAEQLDQPASTDPHVPITRVVDEKLAQRTEDNFRRTAKEFVWGLLLGLIMGFILGVIVKGLAA